MSGRWRQRLLWLALALALLGLWWTPHPPGAQAYRELALSGPSAEHWLGVDPLGRDFLSRLWRGLGNTVAMSLGATLVALALSGLLLLAEQAGGRRLGRLVGVVVNLWVAVPVVFLGLLLLVVLRPSPGALVAAAGLGTVPLCFRQMRVIWREQRTALYVEATEVLGASRWQLLRTAIWPNVRTDLLALSKLLFAIAALELSGLAFLGLLGDPDFPELGAMLKQHQADLYRAPMLVVWPGLLLSLLLLWVHGSKDSDRQ